MELLSLGADLFHTDGQIDRRNLIIAFRNFANALTSLLHCICAQSLVLFQSKVENYKLHCSK
jgi:hypothetical protein